MGQTLYWQVKNCVAITKEEVPKPILEHMVIEVLSNTFSLCGYPNFNTSTSRIVKKF